MESHRLNDGLIIRLIYRLKPFWGSIVVYLLIVTVYELLQLAGSYSISAGIKYLVPNPTIENWMIFIIAMVVFKIIFVSFDAWVDWTIVKILYAIEHHLNVRALDKFLEMRLAWHQLNNSGALVGKVHNGTDKTIDLLAGYLWEFIPTLIQAITNTIALWVFGWPIVAVSYGLLAIFLFLTVKAYHARKALREERHDLYEKEWARFVETVQGIQEIISTNQGSFTLQEYETVYNRICQLGLREAQIGIFTYNTSRNLLVSLGDIAITIFLLWKTITGQLNIGDLFFVYTVVQRLFHAFWRFARLFDRTGESSEGFLRFDTLLKQIQTPIFGGIDTVPLGNPVQVEIQSAVFGYNGTDRVIDDLTLTIPAGKTIAIVGSSGSGKSTLAKMLKGLWPVRSGQILLNGVSIYDLREEQFHNTVAIVNQADDIFIFDGTIEDNLRKVNPTATTEQIVRATKIANIHEEILAFKDGYQTIVGEKGIHLSGGQKQRLAIARAILRDPQVLILDEPTSGLDLENETKVKKAIFASAPGRTTIIIAHRLSTIRDADEIIVMEQGQIVERGNHESLLKQGGIYAHLHELDQQNLIAA